VSERHPIAGGPAPGRLEILMVRHAHADWVPDESRPLSARGARDAETVARRVEAGEIPTPRAIYSSPYRRAIQTVEPLAVALALEIRIVEDLRERTLAEGAVADFPAAMRACWEDPDLALPGGESSSMAVERFAAAMRDVGARHDGGVIAIATHGNILGLWLRDGDPRYGYDFWSRMSWPDIYKVTLVAGRLGGVERLWEGGVEWQDVRASP
jgi:2,3-bisphosphoglycerate-dependent phosphoglycerate mutase